MIKIIKNFFKEINFKIRAGYTKEQRKYKNYDIGRYTYGRPNIIWGKKEGGAELKIGSFCSIAKNVTIFLGGNHRPDWITTYPFNIILKDFENIKGTPTTKGKVTIGNDVWIGMGATILSGVTIGDGAVIGANTLVSKPVEPYSIHVGNPGKTVKKRFDEKTIKKLLELKWWNWDIKKIKENVPLLLSNKVHELIMKNEK